MKAEVQVITVPPLVIKSLPVLIAELVKARLTLLVLLTAMVGFYMGSPQTVDGWLMFHALMGTALIACGASALNQLLERRQDALMRRTQDRPLPSGRLTPEWVLAFGLACSAAGLAQLAFGANALAAAAGATTLAVYVLVYTPLKRLSWTNTLVGAVAGALPPLMGWIASRNDLAPGGWSLFAILFFWQVPHFMAIAWLYREDYSRAGFLMLPGIDPSGRRTARVTVVYAAGVVGSSLLPACIGLAGFFYLAGALILGTVFALCSIQFARHPTLGSARRLFYASIIYLPALLSLLVWDKCAAPGWLTPL